MAGAVAVSACAAPSRRLTPRQVEDPITLPKGMASAWIGASATHYGHTGGSSESAQPGFAYGITDRLQLGLLTLRYAFLDDAPKGPSPGAPLSLAVSAGTFGIGYSSTDGMILIPLLGVRVAKHVGDRWRFDAGVGWLGYWTTSPSALGPEYNYETLVYRRHPWSTIDVDVTARRQLADRFAISVGADASRTAGCLSAFCGWTNLAADGFAGLSFRPWHWLTLNVFGSAGIRARPASFMPPPDPAAPLPNLPRSVTWLSAGGSAVFYW